MKRLILLAATLLVAMVLVGCTQNSPKAYYVMFEKPPNLFDDHVYHQGAAIGEVRVRDLNALQVTRLAISLTPAFREQLKTNSIFFVNGGRLHMTTVDTLGESAAPGAAFLGFPSRMALQWFRAKTAFTSTARAADETAQRLLLSM